MKEKFLNKAKEREREIKTKESMWEIPDERLVMKIPDCNVSITATAEAHFRVGAYCQSIAGRSAGGKFCLNSWSWLQRAKKKRHDTNNINVFFNFHIKMLFQIE